MLRSSPVFERFTLLLLAVFVIAGCNGGGSSSPATQTVSAPTATWFIPEGSILTAAQMANFVDSNQLYFNVQSASNNNGEIRGEISPLSSNFLTDAGNPFAPNPANNPMTYATILGGDQARPRNVVTSASGYGSVTLNPLTREITGFIVTSGIAGSAAHINDGSPGTSGAVVITLEGGPVVWTVPANSVLNEAQMARLSAGACYFNVHSGAFPDGEIRGQLNQQVRFAALKGSNEVPSVTSSATGAGYLALNPNTRQLYGLVKVSDNSSAVTSAVIGLGGAGTNGPGIVNLENRGNGIWSVPVISNPVLTNDAVTAFNNDSLYVNIHTQANPGGELRGQIIKSSGRIGTANLNGTKEIPPVSSQATGTGLLAWNSVTEQVSGSVTTDKVNGTAVNIHSGVATTTGPSLISLTTTSPVTVAPSPSISFALDIQPILTANCALSACHINGANVPMSLEAGVSYANITFLLVPGNSASSYFFKRITGAFTPRMPLNRAPLSATDENSIKKWIDNGALNN
jgi:hypothetical protein